jgi:hypothetical protein
MSAQIPTEPGLYLFVGTTSLRYAPRSEGVCIFKVRGPGAWWSSVYLPGDDRDFYGAFLRVPDADLERATAEANAMVAQAIFHRIREAERKETTSWGRDYERRELLRGLDAEILTMVDDLLKAEAP